MLKRTIRNKRDSSLNDLIGILLVESLVTLEMVGNKESDQIPWSYTLSDGSV